MGAKRRTRGTKRVEIDPTRPIEVNVVARSPHVAAYRLWFRRPESEWERIGDGHTADDVPDFHGFGPVPQKSGFAYWLGIGGNPKTRFRVIVTLAQDGEILEGGTCVEQGMTNADGVRMREREVEFV